MASSGSPRRVPPSVGARVLNLRFGMPRGSHGPPTAPAKRTPSVTDEQRATRAQVLHPAPPAGSLFSESTTTAHGWSVVTSQSRASVFRGSSRQQIWRPVADTEGEWPQSERSNAPRCETGTIFSPAGDGQKSMVLQERKRRTATRADYSPRPSKRPRNQSSIRVRQDEPEREAESPSAAAPGHEPDPRRTARRPSPTARSRTRRSRAIR